MTVLSKGRYSVRLADGPGDLRAAQELRHRAFHPGAAPGLDADVFDPRCTHMLVEERAAGRLVGCFRLLPLSCGAEIGRSYSAQFYDLAALAAYPGPVVELGRFCVDPDLGDADILRVAWGAITRYVDARGVTLLFGCASFAGTDRARYRDAFAMLRDRHLAPDRWQPREKAPQVYRYAARLRRAPDMKRAMLAMPPLLRTYLMMGGWVSDHAVVDPEMNTLHVFTGVEIGAIPPERQRLLRAVAE